MADENATEKRLGAIEAALAHQEAAIRDLSDVAARQWEALEALKRDFERLAREVEARLDARDGGRDAADEPPPPHY